MLTLDNYLTLNEKALTASNLCDRFSDEDLVRIGIWVHQGFLRDEQSRSKWLKRMEAGLDLAMQVQKNKSFPWQGCSNVAFPLITIASMQFHARAYPAMVPGKDLAKCKVFGADPEGKKGERATRISNHMSYQLTEEDEPWEEGHDNLLINYSIIGTAFKKSYFAGGLGHNTSELVMARDLVVDYWAKSDKGCPRMTHVIPYFRNEIYEKVKRGTFRNCLDETWYEQMARPRTNQSEVDNRAGKNPPQSDETTPFTFLEQHCDLDLDDDGYAEPYIITIEQNTQYVVRIIPRFSRVEDIERKGNHAIGSPSWWTADIIKVFPEEYFTRYLFLPSPDGGFYGMGFGALLGPINESVNTAINQLFDAGTMSTLGGGFLARGAKIRGGLLTIRPFGWTRVDSTGDDLRKSMVPYPSTEPSQVLFQVLTLLIQYADRIPGTTEMSVGENPGQNTPAETSRNMITQGMKIYTAIYKRGWRAMKEEFRKLYKLNAVYMLPEQRYGEVGALAYREDYLGDPRDVVPVADPNITSEEMAKLQAEMLIQAAYQRPGYDYREAELRYLRAWKVDGIEQIYPGPGQVQLPPLGPDPKVQVEQMKQEAGKAKLELEKMIFGIEMLETHKMNEMAMVKITAEVQLILSTIASEGDANKLEALQSQVEAMKAQIELRKSHNDLIMKNIDIMMKGADIEQAHIKGQYEIRKAQLAVEAAEAAARKKVAA